MINKKKLIQFYVEQYEQTGRKKQKKPPKYSGMERKAEMLQRALKNARPSRVNIRNLEDLHRQIRHLEGYAVRKDREKLRQMIHEEMLPKLVQLDLGLLLEEQKEGMDGEFLAWLRRTMPGRICQDTLFTLYPQYRQHKVKNKILELVPMRPEMEFAEVREMHRHFILHIGPTNSGKTFRSLERLKLAGCGVYLGPLRLLALAVYYQINK